MNKWTELSVKKKKSSLLYFQKELAQLYYQSLQQAHGYLSISYMRGCCLDYACTFQPLAGSQYCPKALINPD